MMKSSYLALMVVKCLALQFDIHLESYLDLMKELSWVLQMAHLRVLMKELCWFLLMMLERKLDMAFLRHQHWDSHLDLPMVKLLDLMKASYSAY